MLKKKNKLSYRGIECDSQEEIYFLQWLQYFRDSGVIAPIERSKSFLLSEPLVEKEIIQLKTKTKEIEKTILHGHIYTPEFRIKTYQFTGMERREHTQRDVLVAKLSSFLYKIFRDNIEIDCPIEEVGTYFYFEVKPSWDQNNMTRLFKINQKWTYSKYGIFVNLVKPIELFKQTFVPTEYLKTPTGKVKKINFKYKTFEEWIKTL